MNEKRRLFEIIFYDNLKSEITEKLFILENLRYYYIYHYKESKKPHYHLLLYFTNAKTIEQVCKLFDSIIPSNMINIYPKNSQKGRLDYRIKYLIHYKSNDKDRFEYDVQEIITNDKDINSYFISQSNEETDILLLLDYFNTDFIPSSYKTFLNYIYSNNLWSTFRRNAFIFNKLYDETINTQKYIDK